MKIKDYLIGLLLLSAGSVLIAMDGQSLPSITFKYKTREELNQNALDHEVRDLSPRSKKTLDDRFKELGITEYTGDHIYTALASDGSRVVNYDTTPFIFARLRYLLALKKATDSQK